ncbi:MAG: hypothetical protein WCX86_13180, partial [Candidatus Hydrogenedentales bacterium]
SCKMVVGHYGLLRVFQQNYCTEDLCDVLFFCTGCISTLNPPSGMMNLSVPTTVCYADNAGRSEDRLCWRATCHGIPRNGSSRRCVWDEEPYYSSSPHTHRIESRRCLKKRKKTVRPP